MHLPSGENATERTNFVCPWMGGPIAAPVEASQRRTVSSWEPDAMCLPLGENTTDRTKPVCPRMGSPIAAPVEASQIRTVYKY